MKKILSILTLGVMCAFYVGTSQFAFAAAKVFSISTINDGEYYVTPGKSHELIFIVKNYEEEEVILEFTIHDGTVNGEYVTPVVVDDLLDVEGAELLNKSDEIRGEKDMVYTNEYLAAWSEIKGDNPLVFAPLETREVRVKVHVPEEVSENSYLLGFIHAKTAEIPMEEVDALEEVAKVGASVNVEVAQGFHVMVGTSEVVKEVNKIIAERESVVRTNQLVIMWPFVIVVAALFLWFFCPKPSSKKKRK